MFQPNAKILILFVPIVCFLSQWGITDFYVSTVENDATGTGTIGNPYFILGKAFADLTAPDFAGGDFFIFLRGGLYISNATLNTGLPNASARLVITALSNETVRISNVTGSQALRLLESYVVVSNLTFSHDNTDSGISISNGGSPGAPDFGVIFDNIIWGPNQNSGIVVQGTSNRVYRNLIHHNVTRGILSRSTHRSLEWEL